MAPNLSVPRVCVNNLQDRGEKGELWRVFGKFGNLTNVWVADNPPGFAYVFFENFKDAEDAVRHLDGGKICGTKVEVKLSPIEDKRSQRGSYAPRARGRGTYASNAVGRGAGGYRSREGFASPPERPSRYDEDAPRNSREGRSEYREARSSAYTERYSDRGEKNNYGREKDDYGPSSQGRGGSSSYVRGRGSYQSNRGHGRGDHNNGSSGGSYRYSDHSPPTGHRHMSSSRGRTSPPFSSRGRGGYRGESSGYDGGHQYARGHGEQGDQYSSRDGSRGRSGGENARKQFASAPDYDKRARESRVYERSRAYASEYEQGGHEKSDMVYREHRYRPNDKGSYRGSAPRPYQKRDREVPEKDYRKPQDYSGGRDRSPHRRPSYSSTSHREQFEGSSQEEHYEERPPKVYEERPPKAYEERPPKERKRSLTPVEGTFGPGFEDRTPPPATHYEGEDRPTYPEKRSHERSPQEPDAKYTDTRFSPAHSDYGDLPEETAEESGGPPMEDIDHYPKEEEEYGHREALETAGGYKDRRIEYEGREVREVKYEGHHETERSRSASGARSPIHSPIRVE